MRLARLAFAAWASWAATARADVRVGVSVAPLAHVVREVGGDRVRVDVLLPPFTAPEAHAPTPRQVASLAACRLFVAVGHPAFHLETRHVEPVLRRRSDVVIVRMAEAWERSGRPPRRTDDPHLWLSLDAVGATAREVGDALARLDPAHADHHAARAAAFVRRLDALAEELAAALPSPRRTDLVLVRHPAWGHLLEPLGVRQVAIEAEGKDPTPADLVRLVQVARAAGVRSVFVERGHPDRSALVLAREIGARVVRLDPLAPDWEDNLRRVVAAFAQELAHG